MSTDNRVEQSHITNSQCITLLMQMHHQSNQICQLLSNSVDGSQHSDNTHVDQLCADDCNGDYN